MLFSIFTCTHTGALTCAHINTPLLLKENETLGKITCDRRLFLQPLNMLPKDDLLQWERGGCKPEMDMAISGKSAEVLDSQNFFWLLYKL